MLSGSPSASRYTPQLESISTFFLESTYAWLYVIKEVITTIKGDNAIEMPQLMSV